MKACSDWLVSPAVGRLTEGCACSLLLLFLCSVTLLKRGMETPTLSHTHTDLDGLGVGSVVMRAQGEVPPRGCVSFTRE